MGFDSKKPGLLSVGSLYFVRVVQDVSSPFSVLTDVPLAVIPLSYEP